VVADGGCFDAEAVMDFDIGSEGIVALVMRGGDERIRASGGEGSRDVVITPARMSVFA
jgi:hypothetical protein